MYRIYVIFLLFAALGSVIAGGIFEDFDLIIAGFLLLIMVKLEMISEGH